MSRSLHFALIGENAQYSRSPHIFEAIFRQIGKEGNFDLHSVSAARLGACVKRMISDAVNGFSVTIPHKQGIIEYLDQLDPVAASLSAVNSVGINDGRLTGYNTDCYGVSFALKRAGVSLTKGPALVYGSGGAARAVIYALHQDFNIRRFVVCGRSKTRLLDLKQALRGALPAVDIITVGTADEAFPGEGAPAIVVNATPLGGANHPQATPFAADSDWSGVPCYFDLNYNDDNRAVRLMQERGVTVIDGSVMLVAQAVRSFELWTGRQVLFEPIYNDVFGSRATS